MLQILPSVHGWIWGRGDNKSGILPIFYTVYINFEEYDLEEILPRHLKLSGLSTDS